MVVSTVVENGKSATPKKSCAVGIAPGDYRLVGWDMDVTGKKLIDETCQIAGYTEKSDYHQYVMPYKNLNPPAIKRHNMKVVTIGKYRVLKNTKTNKVLPTKCEISALTDFLTWLETVKGHAADGVILVYHEPRKVIPAILLEALKKYNLLERFKQTVKGFANGFSIAEAKCPSTVRAFSLRTLSRTLLNQETQLDNAKDRAALALQIVEHLSLQESIKEKETNGSGDSDTVTKETIEFIREFVQPVEDEEQEYAELKVIFERQNSLRPIFGVLFRLNRRVRQHASPLRRLLAEAGIEYLQLQEAWANGKKEGLEKLIKEKLIEPEEKTVEDLLNVLVGHFDPEKKPTLKVSQDRKEMKTENSKINDDKENNNKCDSGTESPDAATNKICPALKSDSLESSVVSTED